MSTNSTPAAASPAIPSVSLLALYERHSAILYAGIALTGLALGTLLWVLQVPDWPARTWFVATLPPLFALALQMVVSLRRGDIGLDAIALLSMSAALVFGEPLAANVVALMYSGGQLLEAYAAGRAQREMSALVGRVASTAMRVIDGRVVETRVADLVQGDRLLIRHGEVLPVDGRIASASAVLDLSALTGESLPARLSAGDEALSGSTSVGPGFELIATRPAGESTYAGIVALVTAARATKAPAQRLADRYALGFLILTLVIAAAAWITSGDHLRALSVLVVATPCPLILAVPVAMISGLSRAASRGVLIKGGGFLEALTTVRTAVLDKTGTLTHGQATLNSVAAFGGYAESDLLRLAASLEQASGHVLAAALVAEARARSLALAVPMSVSEVAGAGLEGLVDGHRVAVGGRVFIARILSVDPASIADASPQAGSTHIWVAVNGALAGILHLEDRVRPDAMEAVNALRAAGVGRIVLASGDRQELVQEVATGLALDAAYGALTPEAKVEIVRAETRRAPVMMIGDGVNDAPALAAATVGVAMGARGEAASSEAADIVLLVDRLAPIVEAVAIARRTRSIALQSVLVGIGASVVAMLFSAFGYIQPVTGALLQEVIDVVVILNALRALR